MALDVFYARIGYTGSIRPTLENLCELHLRHTQAIAFENLDPFLRRPVRLDLPSLEQKLLREGRGGYCGEEFVLQARLGNQWKTLYRFSLQEQLQCDYELMNWYLSNHPQSHFVTGLIAARPAPGRRYTLRNKELAGHHLGGPTERRTLQSPAELRAALTNEFGICLPDVSGLEKSLARLWMA